MHIQILTYTYFPDIRTHKGTFEVRVVKPDAEPEVIVSLTSMPRPFKKVRRPIGAFMKFITEED